MSVDLGVLELAERYRLSPVQRGQLSALLGQVSNDELAPTSIRSPEGVLAVHLADSLSALDFAEVRRASVIADLGSGAGFPGLALAVGLPCASVRLVESQARKCAFIERASQTAGLRNVEIICRRTEAWPEGACAHDLVVARALAAQPVVLEYAAPLLRVGGYLLDWRGRREPSEEIVAESVAGDLGLRLVEIRHVAPYQDAREHHLHLYLKVRDTPELFPRRPGVARKRPLGVRAQGPV